MSFEGTQLARAMLSIQAAEMEQGQRCPAWRRSDRLERNLMLYRGGSRPICWLGCLLERLGHRLQEFAVPRTLPLGSSAAQQG